MPPVDQRRLAAHRSVSAALDELSTGQMLELVGRSRRRVGIGGSTRIVDVAGRSVFVKLVRVTDAERVAGPDCTQNPFALPTWYQYGVGAGSAGFSAWRELTAHRCASKWVSSGECANFPLLYHWRLLPRQGLDGTSSDPADIDSTVRFWGGSAAVETRVRALADSSIVVALFLEHVPFVLRGWLADELGAGTARAEAAVRLVDKQLLPTVAHIRSRGVSHFDAHFDNVLTDGRRIYLTDFGLATSRHFQLDDAERDFVELTSDHDVAYCAAALVSAIVAVLIGFDGPRERNEYVRQCSLTGAALGLTGLCAETVVRYAGIATIVNKFYWRLHGGEPTAEYPAAAITTALKRAGLLS